MKNVLKLDRTGPRKPVLLPERIADVISQFILDTHTGNIALHVRDGVVLGVTIEEKISALVD